MGTNLGSLVRRFAFKPEFDPKTGVNKKLLKKIEDHIRKYPETYEQSVWLRHHDDDVDGTGDFEKLRSGPMCGTSACVAGWATLFSGKTKKSAYARSTIDYASSAREALGISEELADWLFDGNRSEYAMPVVLAAIRKGQLDIDALYEIEEQAAY